MTVHFIGAGPGAPDLITVRGRDLIARSPVCLYAGSLVPRGLLDHCPEGARIVDTAPLDLDAIIALCVEATARAADVARLHSGDLSIFSAMGEQLRRLERAGGGIHEYARRARIRRRGCGGRTRTDFARPRAIARADAHIGSRLADARARDARQFRRDRRDARDPSVIHALEHVVAELTPFYGPDCPVAIVARASWPDERIVRAPLGEIVGTLREMPMGAGRGLILVGPALGANDFSRERALQRQLRPAVSWRTGRKQMRQPGARNPLLASTCSSRPTMTSSSSPDWPARTRAAVAHVAVGDEPWQIEARGFRKFEGV